MRFIPTWVHAVVDYVVGLFLVFMPWLLGFARFGAETWVPVLLGMATLVYSFFTRYEGGLVRGLAMTTHLTLDATTGLVLLASPWLFGFATWVWLPFVLIGLFEILAAGLTSKAPRRIPASGMARSP